MAEADRSYTLNAGDSFHVDPATQLGVVTPGGADQARQAASALGVGPTNLAAQLGVPYEPSSFRPQASADPMADIKLASSEFEVPGDQILAAWKREGGMRTMGVPATNNGRDVGPFQISPGAVEAVNQRFGTKFTLEDRLNYKSAAKIAAGYLRMMKDQFGTWDAAQAAYQTGPGGYAAGARPGAAGGGDRPMDINLPPQIQRLFSEIRTLSSAKQQELTPLIDQAIQQWRETQPLVKKAFSKLIDSEVDPSRYPQPAIPQSNPLAAFGSVTGIFAAIAAGFTRAPAIAALNGLAGAINGARQADLETYKQQYQAWKDNLDLLFKRHSEMAADYTAAVDLLNTDMTGAKAALQAVAVKYDDPIAQRFNEMDQLEKLVQQQQIRASQIELMRQRAADIQLKNAQITKDTAEATKIQIQVDALKGVTEAHKELDAAQDDGGKDKIAVAEKKLQRAQRMLLDVQQRGLTLTGEQAREVDELVAGGMSRSDALKKVYGDTHPPTMSQERSRAVEDYMNDHPGTSRADAIAAVEAKPQSALTKDALDMVAKTYLRTGQMPYLGFGASSTRIAAMNRAAEIAQEQGHTVDDYIQGRAQLKADTSDLSKMQLIRDSAVAYERSAANEFNLAVSNIPQSPEPLNMQILTRWARTGERQFGDVQVPKFMTALISALDEYAKVISGGTGSVAASTDSARAQALSLIPEGATTKQIPAIVNTIKQGMDFKIASYDDQLAEIRSRISGGNPVTKQAPPTPTPGSGWDGQGGQAPPIPESLQGKVTYWSPSLQKWYDKDGKAYNADGSPEIVTNSPQPMVIRP